MTSSSTIQPSTKILQTSANVQTSSPYTTNSTSISPQTSPSTTAILNTTISQATSQSLSSTTVYLNNWAEIFDDYIRDVFDNSHIHNAAGDFRTNHSAVYRAEIFNNHICDIWPNNSIYIANIHAYNT
ncbi:hypothetical protein NL108_014008 [Boleophthalmus pectinirostris]|nr:hypothetical protein NL108_014008 [Boleophthalmus pectinirostris]